MKQFSKKLLKGCNSILNMRLYVQVSRSKAALSEELMKAKHEIQKSSQSLSMVAKEKEELTREKANLVTSLTASEREVRQQNEVISAYKSDKDALERSLWELNQANNKLESAKATLESKQLLCRENTMEDLESANFARLL